MVNCNIFVVINQYLGTVFVPNECNRTVSLNYNLRIINLLHI